jgi:hypothetical protein
MRQTAARLNRAVAAGLGTLGTVLAFALVVQKSFYFVVTLTVCSSLLVLLGACVYVLTAKVRSAVNAEWIPRFPRQRVIALAGLILLPGLLLVLLTTPVTRAYVAAALFELPNRPHGPGQVSVDQLLLARDKLNCRLEATVRNSLPRQVLVTGIAVTGTHKYANRLCSGASRTTFTVSEQFTIIKQTRLAWHLRGNVGNTENLYPASGVFEDNGCNTQYITLRTKTAVVLEPAVYSNIVIVAPLNTPPIHTYGVMPLELCKYEKLAINLLLASGQEIAASCINDDPGWKASDVHFEVRP